MVGEAEYFRRQLEAIDESVAFVQIFHRAMIDEWADNPLPLFQLGAAIMLEKPVLVVVRPGQELPARLRAIADSVLVTDIDGDPSGSAARIAKFVDEVEIERGLSS